MTRHVQHHLSSQHVRKHELLRAQNAAIHVRLGGEMNDGIAAFRQCCGNGSGIAYVALDQRIVRPVLDHRQVVEISRVSQLVEIDDPVTANGLPDEFGTNETRSASNEERLHAFFFRARGLVSAADAAGAVSVSASASASATAGCVVVTFSRTWLN